MRGKQIFRSTLKHNRASVEHKKLYNAGGVSPSVHLKLTHRKKLTKWDIVLMTWFSHLQVLAFY